MIRTISAAAVLCLVITTGNAATVTTVASSFVRGSEPITGVLDEEVNGGETMDAPSYASTSEATFDVATTSATAFADGDTGILRATANSTGNSGAGSTSGNTSATATITENYTFTGSGTVTFSMLFDGEWGLTRPPVSPGGPELLPFWQGFAEVSINNFIVDLDFDQLCLGTACGPSSDMSASGSVSDVLLSASVEVSALETAPVTLQFVADLGIEILTGDGFVDFGNTALLFVETTDSLMATPSDADFLSNPAFLDDNPPAVPLPASGFLLLGGIGALSLRRTLRQKIT